MKRIRQNNTSGNNVITGEDIERGIQTKASVAKNYADNKRPSITHIPENPKSRGGIGRFTGMFIALCFGTLIMAGAAALTGWGLLAIWGQFSKLL